MPNDLPILTVTLTDGDSVTRLEILPLATSKPDLHHLTVFEGEQLDGECHEEEVVKAPVRLARLHELHRQLGEYLAAYATPELQPVYLAISNTDSGGDADIVRFATEDQLNAWWERVRELAGEGNEEPFGFRHEDGTTDRILTPDEALEIVRKANVVVCAECGKDMVINGDGTTNHLLDGTVGVDAIDYDADKDHAAFRGEGMLA